MGPLLFAAYITNIRHLLGRLNVKYILYADDLQLLFTTPAANLNAAILRTERCIAAISEFLRESYLHLNNNKSEFLLLGTPAVLKTISPWRIHIGDSCSRFREEARDLGVQVNNSMDMDSFVRTKQRSAFAQLRLISRHRRILTRSMRALLVSTLVLPHIDYCISLLAGAPNKTTDKLQRILRAAAHFIDNNQSSASTIAEFGWPSVRDRILNRLIVITTSVLNSSRPVYLHNLLMHRPVVRNLRSNERHLLTVPRTRTKWGDRAFSAAAPKAWNSRPCGDASH